MIDLITIITRINFRIFSSDDSQWNFYDMSNILGIQRLSLTESH